jgi:hypothetical protein
MNLVCKYLLSVAVVFSFCSAATNMARADILINGDFESPALATGSYAMFPSISGWTLTSGPDIEIQNNVAGAPFNGQQFTELDSDGSSSIAQTVATTVGKAYILTFAFSPRPGTPVADNVLGVSWNGGQVAKLSADGSALPTTDWKKFSYKVVATGTSSTLGFADLGTSNSLGTYLDNVTLNPVPEPASVAGFIVGGIALGLLGLRRRMINT